MASFKSAFAAARKAGKKEFSWNGKSYNTELKETAKPKARSAAVKVVAPKARPSTKAPAKAPEAKAPAGRKTVRDVFSAMKKGGERQVEALKSVKRMKGGEKK